ncbi:lung adenoma susceptibility protein 2 isoform X2 [Pseudophryne corroboree]|uniref:lung adenoma susceptibility protein 2 isoform X2 n=1 Tax=Pseudophryne corroboree TaxID=495146 RepID=UPI0030819C94
MEQSSSPDSSISISSLLASCSLSSHSGSSHSVGSIKYKDRLYDSASKALDAYIEDHEESLHSPIASPGKITIRPSPHHSSAKTRAYPKVRHKQPSSSRRRYVPRDPDLLSLTTDDLLCFPSDGTLPFSQASEEKRWKAIKKHYGSHLTSHTAAPSPFASSNRGATFQPYELHDHSLGYLDLQSHKVHDAFGKLKRKSMVILPETDTENNHALYSNLNSPYLPNRSTLCKSYPRWLTSQKSELGVSGITSIPDVKYPVWLRDHGLLDGTDSRIPSRKCMSPENSSIPRTLNYLHGSSSLGWQDLVRTPFHDLCIDERGYNMVHSGRCMDGKKNSLHSGFETIKHWHTPLKSHPNDLPDQNLEQAVEVSKKDSSQLPHNNGSPRTEDVLEAERSWENIPYSFKSPVPVLDEENRAPLKSSLVEDFLNDCAKKENKATTFSGGNHHGPVEALKHMLFNLQAFHQNFNQEKTPEKMDEKSSPPFVKTQRAGRRPKREAKSGK